MGQNKRAERPQCKKTAQVCPLQNKTGLRRFNDF